MSSTPHLILGSSSPRRKEILTQAGFTFQSISFDVPEDYPQQLPKNQVGRFLAERKNDEYRKKLNQEILLTADTTVIFQTELLEKPVHRNDAVGMLEKLSGTSHEVVTGFCISSVSQKISTQVTTTVFFKDLSQSEIDYYVDTYKPYDKAGAYGIQEWIGLIGIERIDGSYFNVVGLPIFEVAEILRTEFGISPRL